MVPQQEHAVVFAGDWVPLQRHLQSHKGLSPRGAAAVAGPGGVVKVTVRRFGGASTGSLVRGGNSVETTRRRSRITSKLNPLLP